MIKIQGYLYETLLLKESFKSMKNLVIENIIYYCIFKGCLTVSNSRTYYIPMYTHTYTYMYMYICVEIHRSLSKTCIIYGLLEVGYNLKYYVSTICSRDNKESVSV